MIKRKKTHYQTIENQIIYSHFHHSHIKGTGIRNLNHFKYISKGFVGQICSRKAATIFLCSVKSCNIQKINIVIIGNSSTGKTCLSIAIGLSIDKHVPFVIGNGSELNFINLSRIKNIKQMIRKAIGVKFFNESFIIQGKVINIKINEKIEKNKNYYAKLVLKSEEIQSIFEINFELYSQILNQMIQKGDIIMIDKGKNIIEKLEFNDKKLRKKETMTRKIVKQDLERQEIHEHIITIYELDLLNSFSDIGLSKLYIDNIPEISDQIREKIDKIIMKWQKNKKISIIKGILLLENANILKTDLFSFLSKNIESFLCPSIILTTGNSDLKINDSDVISSYGIPVDFLDRFLLIQNNPYSYKEIKEILALKTNQEAIYFSSEALELLIKIGIECGIRYCIYVLSIISLTSYNKFSKIDIIIVKKSFLLFVDSKRFSRYTIKLPKKKKIFNYH
jgi:DNA helicase TIP49 (TBP-interacting protein)